MIMYEPQTGMPFFVFPGMENDYLAKGYRMTPPEIQQEVIIPPPSIDQILVNSVSLKDLTEKLGLSTSQAMELRDGRPYALIEELIAKIPGIDWISLSSQISFSS